jgi:hypothetical protein
LSADDSLALVSQLNAIGPSLEKGERSPAPPSFQPSQSPDQ